MDTMPWVLRCRQTMDLLNAAALSAAFLVPVIAGAQDLNQPDIAPMALNSFSAVPPAITSAKVFDQRDRLFGAVKGIEPDASGKPDAISIQPTSGQLIVVAAGDVSYDQEHNIVITAVVLQGIASVK
jgi:hypothetical protein